MNSKETEQFSNKLIAMIFVVGLLSCCLIYFIFISLYNNFSEDPIIFFASIIISLFTTFGICYVIYILTKKKFCGALLFLLGISYFSILIIISVFGPTFIDRSISYHIVFYAVEEGTVQVEEIEEAFSNDIFNKRIHDAVVSGVLIENDDGSLSPTIKCKLIYYILRPIGELTNSMGNYYEMKNLVG